MSSLLHYLMQSPSAIADLFIMCVAVATLIVTILYARMPKDEPQEMEQPAGAWPPAPANGEG